MQRKLQLVLGRGRIQSGQRGHDPAGNKGDARGVLFLGELHPTGTVGRSEAADEGDDLKLVIELLGAHGRDALGGGPRRGAESGQLHQIRGDRRRQALGRGVHRLEGPGSDGQRTSPRKGDAIGDDGPRDAA